MMLPEQPDNETKYDCSISNTTGDDMTIEEQVAGIIATGSSRCNTDGLDCVGKTYCENCYAEAILSLPDIKRGLELLEGCRYEDGFEASMSREDVMIGLELVKLKKAGKLVMLHEDQSLPKCSRFYHAESIPFSKDSPPTFYDTAKQKAECPMADWKHTEPIKIVDRDRAQVFKDAAELTGICDLTGGLDPAEHIRRLRDA